MDILGFDIETIPNQDIPTECVPTLNPDTIKYGNTKDPAKRLIIEEKAQVEFNEKLDKKMSVDPDLCQLCTFVGMVYNTRDDEIKEKTSVQIKDADDLEAVIEGWEAIRKSYQARIPIVSYNGIGFDLPVILHRAIIQDTPVDQVMYGKITAKWSNMYHYDLMQILSGWDKSRWKKMDFYLKLYGLGSKEGIDGSMVYPYWKDGKFDEIQKYCENDVLMTCKLFARIQHWFKVELRGGGL